MTPGDLDRELREGQIRPIYLVLGEERFLADRAQKRLREAALAGAIAEFNEDQIQAGPGTVGRALAATRTVPMMAARRLVVLRAIDRWETDDGGAKDDKRSPLDQLADYAAEPVPTTTLVLTATKLNGSRKIVSLAKKQGFLVQCDRLPENALGAFVIAQAEERGNRIDPATANALAQLVGSELAFLVDAVERLSLFVGAGAAITEDAISEVVVRLRETSNFVLLNALSSRDLGRALAAFDEVFDARSGGLPLLGMLAWNVRQLLRFEAAVAGGSRPEEAAVAAGAPPFKGRELASVTRQIPRLELERWLALLAEADLALKSSRRPSRAIMETLLVAMCRRGA